jgi:hypothetical protein
MALFLTLTGYWIYIDQAYTPNAGESLHWRSGAKLIRSGNLCHHLQCCLWNVMGSSSMVVSSRDHAPPIQGQGSLVVDRYQLALCESLLTSYSKERG